MVSTRVKEVRHRKDHKIPDVLSSVALCYTKPDHAVSYGDFFIGHMTR